MTAKECRTRISLNRSLVRLGIAAAETPQMPLVFIENELAIAVRRFGVSRVIRCIVRQKLQDWWIKFNLDFEADDSR